MATVGFVANHLERGGGLELYELAMAEGLHRRGWDVLVAYEHDGDLSDSGGKWRWATTGICSAVPNRPTRGITEVGCT